jgi:hypothetical protein
MFVALVHTDNDCSGMPAAIHPTGTSARSSVYELSFARLSPDGKALALTARSTSTSWQYFPLE